MLDWWLWDWLACKFFPWLWVYPNGWAEVSGQKAPSFVVCASSCFCCSWWKWCKWSFTKSFYLRASCRADEFTDSGIYIKTVHLLDHECLIKVNVSLFSRMWSENTPKHLLMGESMLLSLVLWVVCPGKSLNLPSLNNWLGTYMFYFLLVCYFILWIKTEYWLISDGVFGLNESLQGKWIRSMDTCQRVCT